MQASISVAEIGTLVMRLLLAESEASRPYSSRLLSLVNDMEPDDDVHTADTLHNRRRY